MANPIHCDSAGCELLADVMVSRLTDGETTAFCFAHYVPVARAVVELADEAQAQAEEADAVLAAEVLAAEVAEVEAEDERVAERLTRYAASQAADPEAPISSGDEAADLGAATEAVEKPVAAGEPGPDGGGADPAPADQPTGPTVVRKGTSASRRRYEAKERAKQQAAEAADQEGAP